MTTQYVTVREGAEARARTLHHDLAEWEKDDNLSGVAWCRACGLPAAVDLDMLQAREPIAFGSAITIECTGRRNSRPEWSTAHA